jgi:3'-5' exoribonuclease
METKLELLAINETLRPDFAKLNLLVLNDDTFYTSPASKGNHHSFVGGLGKHVLEVVKAADFICSQNSKINRNIVITGAIWHDFLKTESYEEIFDEKENKTKWEHKSYNNRIGHIVGSYHAFLKHAEENNHSISEQDIEHVCHLILSHHRLPEWGGSSIQPKTKEAWALHFADCVSAFCGKTRDGDEDEIRRNKNK